MTENDLIAIEDKRYAWRSAMADALYDDDVEAITAMLADGKPHDVRVFLAEGRTDYNDLTDAALEAEFRERINAEG